MCTGNASGVPAQFFLDSSISLTLGQCTEVNVRGRSRGLLIFLLNCPVDFTAVDLDAPRRINGDAHIVALNFHDIDDDIVWVCV